MRKIFSQAISHNTSFWVCLSIAVFLIIGGALTPPYFVIDSSIFIATGELWLFAALGAAIKAIDTGRKAEVKRGDTTITIGHDTNNNTSDVS